MRGPRETVAKALALECMRGAHRQQRKCYLYAFSGPGEVNEFELKLEPQSLERLLQFLANSFEVRGTVRRRQYYITCNS
jgi:uncharacterized protein with von Willebrand factor type A (vWA) domain